LIVSGWFDTFAGFNPLNLLNNFLTLNQRVQGPSPCAPTKQINSLV
jgi:hypothetical protein